MAIRKRANKYELDISLEGKRHRISFATKKQAEIAETKIKLALQTEDNLLSVINDLKKRHTNKHVLTSNKSLAELFQLTLRRYWQGSAGEETAIINASAALQYFGHDASVKAITQQQIDNYVEHLKELGNSNATINRKLSALSKMLSVAVDRQWIPYKPKIEKLKESQGRIRYLTDEEEQRLIMCLKSIEQAHVADLVICLIDTGCRLSEILTMSKRDIHNNLLTLWKTKNGEARTVPLTARVMKLLESYDEKPFATLSQRKLRTAWNNAKAMMRLEDDSQFVPHCLRHTCASRLVQRGVPLTVVKEWLGHKSIQVTLRYSHLSPTNLLQALDVLEASCSDTNRRNNNSQAY